jgi:hypothetical protein
MLEPAQSFQATDLARNARDVLDAARTAQGALIRDKDGTNFRVVLAGRASEDNYILEGLSSVLRLLRLASLESRDPALYGDLAWIAPLPTEAQFEFAWALAQALQSIPSTGLEPVESLTYDWHQTARAWVDDSLRSDLQEDIPNPLLDVEL